MKKTILISLLLIAFINCNAQLIITNHPVDVSVAPINFNPELIKQNKIKNIVLDIVDKPDGSVIIDKDATQGYEFDLNGNLIRYYYTILNKTQTKEVEIPAIKKHGRIIRQASTATNTQYINDTIFINMFYDEQSRIIVKRLRTGDYYDAFYFEYNPKGQLKKELHCRETNISENKNEFKLGVQKILSSETFEYTTLTPTQIKKSCLNDEGREYKKAIINYDAKGNKLSENYEFIVSWMRQENSFQYDNSGRLKEQLFTSNESSEIKSKSIFEYDKSGILLSEKKFKNEEATIEINYLYNETNTLIKSEVNRDFKNSSIEIVKFAYSFY